MIASQQIPSFPSKPLPVGTRIPSSPHAVSVSLPTIADVIAYENKDPGTMAKIGSGYPRFVQHSYIRKVCGELRVRLSKPADTVSFVMGSIAASRDAFIQEDLGSCEVDEIGNWALVTVPEADARMRSALVCYLQHTGAGLSSREAEDWLVAGGLESSAYPEERKEDGVLEKIRQWMGSSVPSDTIVCKGGMNAFYACFQAVNDLQVPKGRNQWVSIGWLYLDTMKIMARYQRAGGQHVSFAATANPDDVLAYLSKEGSRIAGVVLEAPTNPMLWTPDLTRISNVCRRVGAKLMVDPSLVSPANVDVSPWCDLVPCSLTKYAAHSGDVMMGAVSVSLESKDGQFLSERVRRWVQPPYFGDLHRLGFLLDDAHEILDRINRNTCQLAAFLESHPKVDTVRWAYHSASAESFRQIARKDHVPGGVISIRLKDGFRRFFDNLRVSKGPSFGTRFSLACPYLYLAHYELVSTPGGCELLRLQGLFPDLVRLSVGIESIDDQIEVLREALDA